VRSALPVVLLLASVLAGCSGSGPPAPGPVPESPAEAAFALEPPIHVAANPNNQAEAVVSVSPDGLTVLTCFHGFFSSLSPGYASTDGGLTWRRMEFPATGGVGGDCETALTGSGAWVFLASTVAGATVLVSTDQGASWASNPVTAIPTNGLADRPWIEAVGDELWLAYMPLNFQPGTVGFVKSTDLGRTWSLPVHVGLPGPEGVTVRHGHFAVANATGAVHLPMVRALPDGTTPRVVQVWTTSDGGESWTGEDALSSTQVIADWPSMGVSEAGDQFVAYTGYTENGSAGTFGLHRAPGATAFSQGFTLHDPGEASATWPWIAGGAGRKAHFVVEGGPDAEEGPGRLWIGEVDGATLEVRQVPVGEEPFVEFASLDHDASGRVYAVWVDNEDGQYLVRSSVDPAPGTASSGAAGSASTPAQVR
jgi:hypothetical protein